MLELPDYVFEALLGIGIVGMLCVYRHLIARISRIDLLLSKEKLARATIEKDVAALVACSQNIGMKVRDCGVNQHRLQQKFATEKNSHTEITPGYDQVYKLVAQGLGIEEIADICGLGRGEVELLSRVAEHRSAA